MTNQGSHNCEQFKCLVQPVNRRIVIGKPVARVFVKENVKERNFPLNLITEREK